jgi:long-chain fatty acid transport protein
MSEARVRSVAAILAAFLLVTPRAARASNVLEYPEEGNEATGRGGAWVARATDPVALATNPAGLAGQPLRLSVGEDLAFRRACFTRLKAANDTTDDGVAAGASYARVCDDAGTFPVGYLAMSVPIGTRFALGAGVVTPHGLPRTSWPMFVAGRPAPQRYMLVESKARMAVPTFGAAFEILPGVRLGASVGWGLAWVETSAAAPGLRQDGVRPEENDVKVTVKAVDLFVPRASAGAHASLGRFVEIGGALHWSAPIEARGDARTEAGAFSSRAAAGDTSKVAHGDTSLTDCGQPGSNACGDGGNARLTIPIPMDAALGVRVKVPREGADPYAPRDPMETELGDVEIDVTWANDSAIDRYGLQFPGQNGVGSIPVPGTAGTLPPNADTTRRFRDVVGVRAGGDVNVVPGVVALRAGGFLEPRAAEPGFAGLETSAGTRVGVAVGATARIHAPRGAAFDVSLALLHVFVSDVEQSDPRADGTRAITGTRCDGSATDVRGTCADGAPAYHTKWPVALGKLTSALDVVSIAASYRF